MNPVENKTATELRMSATKKIVFEEDIEEVEETYEEESVVSEEEEQSTKSSVDDELEALEKEMKEKMERIKALKAKKAMDTHKTAVADRLKERYNKKFVELNNRIEKLVAERDDMESRVESIEGAEDEELLDLLTSKEYLEDAENELSMIVRGVPTDLFANLVADAVEPEPEEIPVVTAKPLKKKAGGKGTRTAIDRKAYPAMLQDKMVFYATGNLKGTKDKVSLAVIFNAQDKCFYRYDKKNMTKYELLQDANREWCNARGYDKLGNAWEDFKALNIKNSKTRSIQNLHNEIWIATEGAAYYIDAKWKW